MLDRLIEEIALIAGLAPSYRDASGTTVHATMESQRAVLQALGFQAETAAQARDALGFLTARRQPSLPPVIVARAGRASRIPLRGAAGRVRFAVIGEDGTLLQEGSAAPVDSPSGVTLALPGLPEGYFDLDLRWDGGGHARSRIISAPDRCHEPDRLVGGDKGWGVTTQLYALRSRQNFGIGDYADAATLAARSGELGASFLGFSPVHALFVSEPAKSSPYSPSSRLMLDPQYINPVRIEGFEQLAPSLRTEESRSAIEALRAADLVDRDGAWQAKRPLLDALWRDFRRSGRDEGFAQFRAEGGTALSLHATFDALSEHFWDRGARWIGEWPEAYRDAASEAVARFAADHEEQVGFHIWLQWQAERQLAAAQHAARGSGMDIGLFRDLAVGVDRAGSEVWSAPARFATSLSIGAPPDPIGPAGQNWGLPPLNPFTLAEEGFAHFRAILEANMRHAGAIRIDHAFQLQRLFLIPEGAPASAGVYLGYPFEALLAVLRLESARAGCMVIAEDLGTGPEGFSDALMAAGVYSYRVLPFERDGEGAFHAPGDYPERALAVLTTHDLPTFRGWWKGLDVDLRHASGLHSAFDAERDRTARDLDRRQLIEALASQKLLPADLPPPSEPPIDAAIAYLARTSSNLAAIQTEDAAGELNQANLPGLDARHPNWQRRLSVDIETLTAPRSDLARFAALFANEGRGGEKRHGTALAAPPPRATYRLQFHRDFTFADGARVVPYLSGLGISHVYASPIFTARPGSVHGYDIVDHAAINPELGGREGFEALSDALRQYGMGLILDIVPNHMGVGGADNGWWLSVLEWGRHSPHAAAFDIDWDRLGANGKLIVPFLGEGYGDALENGHLKLRLEADRGTLSIWHWEHRFPLSPLTYPVVLDRALLLAESLAVPGFRDLLAISSRLRVLAENGQAAADPEIRQECEMLKDRLANAIAASPALAQALERTVRLINGEPDIPESFETLHRILEGQAYRLAYWRVASSDINYRRFFDINSLAGIRVEDPEVFESTHRAILDLVAEDRIHGLRIDHVDGLADPAGYLETLQRAVGPGFYILVEKILGPGEELGAWPISGTTGYEVLNLIDGVLVDRGAARELETAYREASGLSATYETMLRQARRDTLETSFASELEVLVSDLVRITQGDRHTRDYTVHGMRRVLGEIIERFPVYRSYVTDTASAEDRALVGRTVAAAREATSMAEGSLHDLIGRILLAEHPGAARGSVLDEDCARFRRRFQQLTGPVMAKSLEDTLFYRYGPLLALNEVGGEPQHFGVTPESFHAANVERRRNWPHAMIASATHDTKRGEDGRARLLALSEIPAEWRRQAASWQELSRRISPDAEQPDGTDRHLILQQLVAAWPFELIESDTPEGVAAFRERMETWVEKALREAKRHTSWTNPRAPYEEAAKALIAGGLDPRRPAFREIQALAASLAGRGVIKSLARTVLKYTVPGIPDTYQGTEAWDLALVDPDNRRPVDFGQREAGLADAQPVSELMKNWRDGRIKQALISRLLEDRRLHPRLYELGDYQPVMATGPRAGDLIAFTRYHGSSTLLVIATRATTSCAERDVLPAGGDWEGTGIGVQPGEWRDVLTGRTLAFTQGDAPIAQILDKLPVAVLHKLKRGE